MASDLSEKIKEINASKPTEATEEAEKPTIAEALKSPSPKVTEVANRLDKAIDEHKSNIVNLPYIEEKAEEPKKVIKNDWQQPAMFYVDFLMRVSMMVCAIVVICYLLRLMLWS